MKEFFKENVYFIILGILCVIGLFLFCGHYSGILIDFGREVYYPEQILQGKVLYKDLFNIYGPLSYQINAILYCIFGAKLSTLYGIGCICSLLIVSGIYLVANKFFSKFLSFCIGFFTLAIGIYTTSIFNFDFPYSWSVVYGLICFIYSLFFLLKYNDDKKDFNLLISSFLCGSAIAFKYDFLVYAFIILFFIIKHKKFKALLSFLISPILSFGILFIQGLGINDLINSLTITKLMAQSKTLKYFYQNSGIYFHPKAILTNIVLFLEAGIPLCGIIIGVLKNKKWLTILSFMFFIFLLSILNPKFIFGFLPILIFICGVLGFKNFNKGLKILILSTIAVCTKTFWVLLIGSYGNYYISIALIACLGILFFYIPKNIEKFVGIYLLIIASFFIYKNISDLQYANGKIETNKGIIYTDTNLSDRSNQLLDFIKKNTKNTDKIVIFPEGMTINFLGNRVSDDFYNSMLPLYVETFGEDRIIKHFKENSPEYIILSNLDMKDYYFKYICNDYGLEFCSFVQANYNFDTTIENNNNLILKSNYNNFRYLIFKKK